MPAKFTAQRLEWPLRGMDENASFLRQGTGTTPSAQNVRSIDPETGRSRGAQRAGLSKYLDAQHTAAAIQEIGHVVSSAAISGATVRTFTRYAIAGGNWKTFTGSAFTTPAGGSGCLSSSVPVVFSQPAFGSVFAVDGTNSVYLNSTADTVATWTASSGGTLPSGCRIIELYRGRVFLSGTTADPHNWFMSEVGDPFQWEYNRLNCETDPISGNTGDIGKLEDIVTAFIPGSDNIAIVGGDKSIFLLTGDPLSGGRFQKVTDSVGIAFGRAWCIDPSGMVWFWGSRGGLYRMAFGGQPEKISRDFIDKRLAAVNLSTHLVRLAYNDTDHGVHIFLSPTTAGATTHYFFDAKNGGFWPDVFGDTDHNPLAIHIDDDDSPSGRTLLLGGMDGYIRKWDATAASDDGTAIDSFVWLGPVRLRGAMRAMMLRQIQPEIARGSDDVAYEVYVGKSPEEAFNASALFSGTFSAGRGRGVLRGARGEALYLRLRNNTLAERWALEEIVLELQELGPTAQRAL